MSAWPILWRLARRAQCDSGVESLERRSLGLHGRFLNNPFSSIQSFHCLLRFTKWYGHVSRSSRLVKTILEGTVKGARTSLGLYCQFQNNPFSSIQAFHWLLRFTKWYRHVSRSSGLVKTISEGTMKGARTSLGLYCEFQNNPFSSIGVNHFTVF